ncbi:hypothetical protein BC936DRAFT_142168 [Jimgerdemannia flammicorona]|uniref:Uncharacterized protein n=1 Tax=Jimgerdemannia flammicorona TaxID=994334 RepID=A0A433A0X9_9FUNG|nr:hypothetical protein BC936DRAFT_142168 [Jimgerdemannia flammicorona]
MDIITVFCVDKHNNVYIPYGAFNPITGDSELGWNYIQFEVPRFMNNVTVLLKVDDTGRKQSEQNSTFFIERLRQELSESIPIPETRITLEYSSKSSSTAGLYFELTFSASKNLTNEMNSDGAATYLAMLISNPQTTNLQYGNYTKYLDPAVPAIIQYNIWQEFKLPIIVISSAFPVLIIVVLFARRRHKKGRNLAIISIILKLSDFILDSLFVVDHSHDIPDLTTPIMIFYVAPFAMNFLIAAW